MDTGIPPEVAGRGILLDFPWEKSIDLLDKGGRDPERHRHSLGRGVSRHGVELVL